MMIEWLSLWMFACAILILLLGYPVAFSLSGTAIIFAALGHLLGHFDWIFLQAIAARIYGVMGNETLLAIPLFILMGTLLERTRISEDLLEAMGQLFGSVRGGLGISVCLVGALLAASTGIVGATVVTMGLISLASMLKYGYHPPLATGVIAASGTLGQIIPPSIILIILGDVISSANQQAQMALGNFAPTAISVGDLFVGALFPGLLLVGLYVLYVATVAWLFPHWAPALPPAEEQDSSLVWKKTAQALVPPLLLIVGVLGSILAGIATPTEAASVGCMGALLLAVMKKRLSTPILKEALQSASQINCMVFVILIGASIFSLVFRGYGGDELVHEFLTDVSGGLAGAFITVMLVIFVMGFFLDFFEITFVVVPIVGPILLEMGLDPIWLGIMIALNLQTSFLTPPFGFALFYLRGVAPDTVSTGDIYRGVLPFIGIQLLVLVILWVWPELATWLPSVIYG